MFIAYIAHPIGGDVKGNMALVEERCGRIFKDRPEVIPVAPYLMALKFLDDGNPADRLRGVSMNREFFSRRLIDELWLFGPKISSGMWEEVLWARKYGIPVIPMSGRLTKELALRELKEGSLIQLGCSDPEVVARLVRFMPDNEGVVIHVRHMRKAKLLRWEIPWCDIDRIAPYGVPLISPQRYAA